MAAPRIDMACEDISAFKETLRVMRKVDDNIVNALNTAIPTASFAEKANVTNQCKDLYDQGVDKGESVGKKLKLLESHRQREKAIKRCIDETSKELQLLKEKKSNDPDNFEIIKDLRKAQSRFRLMQNELNIEEVVRDRSTKVFYERCRFHYKPDDLKI